MHAAKLIGSYEEWCDRAIPSDPAPRRDTGPVRVTSRTATTTPPTLSLWPLRNFVVL